MIKLRLTDFDLSFKCPMLIHDWNYIKP